MPRAQNKETKNEHIVGERKGGGREAMVTGCGVASHAIMGGIGCRRGDFTGTDDEGQFVVRHESIMRVRGGTEEGFVCRIFVGFELGTVRPSIG